MAGPIAYIHYARCHKVYPLLIYGISAKLQSIWLLCHHTYTMQQFNYISAKLWPTSWSNRIHALCEDPGSASYIDLLYPCKVWPIWPLSQHAYTMMHIHYISAKLWPTGQSNSMHTLCRISWGESYINLLHICLLQVIQLVHHHTHSMSNVIRWCWIKCNISWNLQKLWECILHCWKAAHCSFPVI